MPAVTISWENHDEELAVLGSRDQFLRQVRDTLGVKVLARRGEIKIEGDADRVDQARQVFEGLRRIYKRQRAISAGDVADAIDVAVRQADPSRSDEVEIREGNRLVRARTG